MDKILFLHGFNSKGNCSKKQCLENNLSSYQFISPDIPTKPIEAVQHIQMVINQNDISRSDNVYILGCNLGSFYSLYFSEKLNFKCFLIDPIVNPYEMFLNIIGKHYNWHSNNEVNITRNDLDYINLLERKLLSKPLNSNMEVGLNEDDIYFDSGYEFFKNKYAKIFYYDEPKNTEDLVNKISTEIFNHFR